MPREELVAAESKALQAQGNHDPKGSGKGRQLTTEEPAEGEEINQDAEWQARKAKPPDGKAGNLGVLLEGSKKGLHNVGESKWTKFPEPLIIDSGAAETVLPKTWFLDYECRESAGSRNGQHYSFSLGINSMFYLA